MNNINTNHKYKVSVFVLNKLLQYVGMSWIIETHEKLRYDMDKNNPDFMTGGPWYNTSICKKIHGTVFEEFIRNEITDRYNIMYSIHEY